MLISLTILHYVTICCSLQGIGGILQASVPLPYSVCARLTKETYVSQSTNKRRLYVIKCLCHQNVIITIIKGIC